MKNLPLHHCTVAPGETLRYRRLGSGPRPLVLVHGLAARSEAWTDLVPLLPRQSYTVYFLDLLGSGASDKPRGADYSIRAHSLRLLEFLARESLERVTVIGHSLGGAVVLLSAVEAMSRKQDRLVSSMIIIGGPGFIQRLPLMAEIFQNRLAARLFIALYAPDIWIKMGLRMAYHDHGLVDREHVARYAPCYRDRAAKRALVETCRSLIPPDQHEIVASYGKLRLPVLLIWGRHDNIVPLSQGKRLEEAIPGARLHVVEECGHNPQEEKPEQTMDLIDGFLKANV